MNEVSQEEMTANMGALSDIYKKAKELNRINNQLRHKYHGDSKYARIHKRLNESSNFTKTEQQLFEALIKVKSKADDHILQNTQLLDNESYFEQMIQPIVISEFYTRQNIKLTPDATRTINHLVVSEYINEFFASSRAASNHNSGA